MRGKGECPLDVVKNENLTQLRVEAGSDQSKSSSFRQGFSECKQGKQNGKVLFIDKGAVSV